MKKRLIVALLCVNVALVLALAMFTGVSPAKAQVVGGGQDYLLITGHVSDNFDAVYVIELGSQRLAPFEFNKTKKQLVPYRGVDLKQHFRRR